MINIVNVKINVLNIMRAVCPLIYFEAKIVSDKVMIECATPNVKSYAAIGENIFVIITPSTIPKSSFY